MRVVAHASLDRTCRGDDLFSKVPHLRHASQTKHLNLCIWQSLRRSGNSVDWHPKKLSKRFSIRQDPTFSLWHGKSQHKGVRSMRWQRGIFQLNRATLVGIGHAKHGPNMSSLFRIPRKRRQKLGNSAAVDGISRCSPAWHCSPNQLDTKSTTQRVFTDD